MKLSKYIVVWILLSMCHLIQCVSVNTTQGVKTTSADSCQQLVAASSLSDLYGHWSLEINYENTEQKEYAKLDLADTDKKMNGIVLSLLSTESKDDRVYMARESVPGSADKFMIIHLCGLAEDGRLFLIVNRCVGLLCLSGQAYGTLSSY